LPITWALTPGVTGISFEVEPLYLNILVAYKGDKTVFGNISTSGVLPDTKFTELVRIKCVIRVPGETVEIVVGDDSGGGSFPTNLTRVLFGYPARLLLKVGFAVIC
jgi:hypothetical protein